jgi:transketolase
MRNTFAKEVTQIVATHEKLVLLSGDIGNKLFDEFKVVAPERFYNCGVAEANMTGVAAGLAMMGYRPIIYSITPFATVRCLEQIRVDLCYHNVPVIIVGTGAGLSYASLGPTHHSCDDIGFLRMLPNMKIICPCDPYEVQAAIRVALQCDSPVYIRIGKKGEPNIHKSIPQFTIGKSIPIQEGDDICILSTGNIMPVTLEVAEILRDKKISVQVESFHTVKPLDIERLAEIFQQFPLVVTLEEHSLISGLGGAIAEWLTTQNNPKARLIRFGTRDEFMPYIGNQEYAREYFDLTAAKITEKILKELKSL